MAAKPIISTVLLFLLICVAESRLFDNVLKPPVLECNRIYGVTAGETCFHVTQLFNLTTQVFQSINPNLVCNRLFVGQWICVAGTANN